eukprot:2783560-Pyramimonas_sp.AAC.1
MCIRDRFAKSRPRAGSYAAAARLAKGPVVRAVSILVLLVLSSSDLILPSLPGQERVAGQ